MEETYRSRYEKEKRKRRKQRQKRLVFLCVALFLLSALIFTLRQVFFSVEEALDEPPVSYGIDSNIPHSLKAISTLEDTFHLELVNFEHPLRRSPNYQQFSTAFPYVHAQYAYLLLYTPALDQIKCWFARAYAENIASFFIASGYRDPDTQETLYLNADDATLVNPPGHSEHQTGLAADIAVPGLLFSEMANTTEALWLAETAWEYGFILRYTENTQRITGIVHEPWHFRFVGLPHAYYIWQNNLVLEQYLSRLRNNGVTHIQFLGHNYEVWYQTPIDGKIYTPDTLPFTLSSDNMGGFIITIRIT